MPLSPSIPERERALRSVPPERRRLQMSAPEAKRLKKGMSPRAKAMLVSALALTGAAAVGGVVAKQRFDAMNPSQRLDAAGRIIGGTNWFPWLNTQLRGVRDRVVLQELNSPGGIGGDMSAAQRLALATRIRRDTTFSPEVHRALEQRFVKEFNQTVNENAQQLSTQANNFFTFLRRQVTPAPGANQPPAPLHSGEQPPPPMSDTGGQQPPPPTDQQPGRQLPPRRRGDPQ